MGREARARAFERRIYWVACEVCGREMPTLANQTSDVKPLNVCQVCCIGDLASLMRSNFETVRMLPVVRALRGERPVTLRERSGS